MSSPSPKVLGGPHGLGKLVYRGVFARMPESLRQRGDLVIVPTPQSDEVHVYEPYAGE